MAEQKTTSAVVGDQDGAARATYAIHTFLGETQEKPDPDHPEISGECVRLYELCTRLDGLYLGRKTGWKARSRIIDSFLIGSSYVENSIELNEQNGYGDIETKVKCVSGTENRDVLEQLAEFYEYKGIPTPTKLKARKLVMTQS